MRTGISFTVNSTDRTRMETIVSDRDSQAEVHAGRIVHAILDNYAVHKHPKVHAWLDLHPRFVFHFTPKSASWVNAVEGFLAKLTRRRLKRGVFRSIVDLQAAINRFIVETNQQPRPFKWVADPDAIIAAVRRGHQVLDSIALRHKLWRVPRRSCGRIPAEPDT